MKSCELQLFLSIHTKTHRSHASETTLNAAPGEVSIEIFLNVGKHKFNQQGKVLNSKHMTMTLRGEMTSLPRAKGWQETVPASWPAASHAPSSTYRSAAAQSFHSPANQLALPSSSSSRRGGLTGLHVREGQEGGEASKSFRSLILDQGGFTQSRYESIM